MKSLNVFMLLILIASVASLEFVWLGSGGGSSGCTTCRGYSGGNQPQDLYQTIFPREETTSAIRQLQEIDGEPPVSRGRLLEENSMQNKMKMRLEIYKWTPEKGIGRNLKESFWFNKQTRRERISDLQWFECSRQSNNFKNPSPILMNVDNSLSTLYPGSIVKSSTISTGSDSLTAIPIPDVFRYPLTIATNGKVDPQETKSSSSSDVHSTIFSMLKKMNTFGSEKVYFSFHESKDFKQLFTSLEFNSKVLGKLGISVSASGQWSTKKNKMILTMIQGIASFYVDVKMKDPNDFVADPIGSFLKPSFSLMIFNFMKQLGAWGPSNPPLYVDQVNYGRLIIISVDETDSNKRLAAELKVKSKLTEGEIKAKFSRIFSDRSVKVFSMGTFDQVSLNALKTGNWPKFFSQKIDDNVKATNLQPIGFKLRDFRMHSFQTSNFLQYDNYGCVRKRIYKVQVGLSNIYRNAQIHLKLSNGREFQVVSGSTFRDITSLMSNGTNRIRVSNTGGRPKWWKRWQRDVRLTILIDGKRVYSEHRKCRGCHSSSQVFICYLNKEAGTSSCRN